MYENSICLKDKFIQGCRVATTLCKFLNDCNTDIYVEVDNEWVIGKETSILSIMAFVLPGDYIKIKCVDENIFRDLEEELSVNIFTDYNN